MKKSILVAIMFALIFFLETESALLRRQPEMPTHAFA